MKGKLVSLCLAAACLLFVQPAATRAEALSPAELRPALEELLAEHPEVVLDFLRTHSETLVDVVQMGSDRKRLAALEQQWVRDAKEKKNIRLDNRPRVGAKNAKVQIVAFSDFTCVYCRRAEKTLVRLMKDYEGKVSFVFKNLPLDPQGISGLASQYFVALSLQDEKVAWKFYRQLFENADVLNAEGEKFLRETAEECGANMKKLDSDRRQKSVDRILKEDLEDADKLKIEGTPTFFVNNLVVRGAMPENMFRRAIEIELAR